MKNYNEVAEIINTEIAGCFAYVDGASIEITVRGKKADKVYISNGEVRYKGNCASVAGEIAEKFELLKNF